MVLFPSVKFYSLFLFLHIFVSYLCYNPSVSGAVSLTQTTIDQTLASNELVFINFYADWCKFSNMLAPIFDEAADKIAAAFPTPGQVVIAKVDCDKQNSIASRFHITKYPTLKLIRNGQPAKREYRGQRSSEAFLEFIKKQLEDPILEFTDLNALKSLDSKKRIIIGFFDKKDVPEYQIFRRAASNLKDDCQFHIGFGMKNLLFENVYDKEKKTVVQAMHPPDHPIIVFRPDVALSNERDETYTGSLTDYDQLSVWMHDKCVPLVREITFENAEELTEEGLPFLILFHLPGDTDSVRRFKDVVQHHLISEKQNINFLSADGERFAHPLHHLGKSVEDLPIIAIDSFRHMYLFPDAEKMEEPGKLKAFVQDLYSGKLHREFHYGPDPNDIHADAPTTHPESTFKKLGPSKNRYTLLRDEL